MDAILALLAATMVLVLPGFLVATAARLPWVHAVAVAAPVTLALLSLGGVLGAILGVAWSIPWIALVTLAGVLITAAMAGLLRVPRSGQDDSPATSLAMLVGSALAVPFVLLPFLLAPASLESVAQLNDMPFHLNSVRQITETGDASPLSFTLAHPGESARYYPGAWHALVATVLLLTGPEPITVATNATNLIVGGLALPLGIALLVRTIIGPNWVAVGSSAWIAGLVGAVSPHLLSYGPVYPYHLAVATVPALMAVALQALRPESSSGAPARAMSLLLPWAAIGTGAAHPSGLFSAAVLLIPFLALRFGRSLESAFPVVRAWLAIGVAVLASVAVWIAASLAILATDVGEGVVGFAQAPIQSPIQAVASVLLLVPASSVPQGPFAVLLLFSFYLALRTRTHLGILFAYVVVAGLYIATAAFPVTTGSITQALAGPWYSDPRRIGALLAIPFIMLGGWTLGQAHGGVRRFLESRQPRTRMIGGPSTIASVALGVLIGVVALAAVMPSRSQYLAHTRSSVVQQRYWSDAEWDFSRTVSTLVPQGETLANDPLDGSPLNFAIAGVPVLFPYHVGEWDADRLLVASSLRDASTDPDVCRALTRLGVTHAIEGSGGFDDLGHREAGNFDGINGLDAAPGFTPVAGNADVVLYRIDACGSGASPG